MILTYKDYAWDGIFGTLQFEEGEDIFCVTLSHSFIQQDNSFKPIVGIGVYGCIRGIHKLSDDIPFETFEITGVEGHSGLLFHPGNYNKDSHGCTLLGEAMVETPNGRMVTSSRHTFAKWMDRLQGIDNFILEVRDARIYKNRLHHN